MTQEILDHSDDGLSQPPSNNPLLAFLIMGGGGLQIGSHLKIGYDWLYGNLLWFIAPTYLELGTFITAGTFTIELGRALWLRQLIPYKTIIGVFVVQALAIGVVIFF